jgi:hypothetical protein
LLPQALARSATAANDDATIPALLNRRVYISVPLAVLGWMG